MTAFRLFSRINTFYGLTGQLLAGGLLRFYDAGTTSPRPVYGDPGLTINNGVSVQLDSSGRPDVDVWGDGAYFVEVFDSLGVKQGEADNVRVPGDSGQSIPALEAGKFLTNNGAVLLWAGIREVPDPTGQSGKQLGTDGEAIFWEPKPAPPPDPPAPDIVIGTASLTIGDGGDYKIVMQFGEDSAPGSNNWFTQKAVTFPTPFAKILAVGGTLKTTTIGVQSGIPALAVTGWTFGAAATGATFYWRNIPVGEHDDSNDFITQPVPFGWWAIGLVPK